MRKASPFPLCDLSFLSSLICLALLGCGSEGNDSTESCSQAESCDGEDNDCDGAIDEGLLDYFYQDSDGDGFGQYEGAVACEASEGWVPLSGDCRDDDAAIHPEQPEICDQIDQDCDILIDENAFTEFYADQDQDGHGDPDIPSQACEAPNGFVAQSDDCNDSDSEIYPGGLEVCDGKDQDCDNTVDEGHVQPSGWIESVCNPINLQPESSPLSDAVLVFGMDTLALNNEAIRIFETIEDGSDDVQDVTVHGFPSTIYGSLHSTGFDGLAYTGDVDTFRFTCPNDGTATLLLSMPPGIDGEFLLYDQKSESYSGPFESGESIQRSFSESATYSISVAAKEGEPSDYEFQLSFEGNGTLTNTQFRMWYSAQNLRDDGWIGTTISEDALTWTPDEYHSLEAEDCMAHDAISVGHPTVIQDTNMYHMWFQIQTEVEAPFIAHATSLDGNNWICDPEAALRPNDEDERGGLWYPAVRKGSDGLWRMWYGIGSPTCAQTPCPPQSVALATTANLGSWTRSPNSAVDLQLPGDGSTASLQGQHVIELDGQWLHLFSLLSRGTSSIYGAVSDGNSWPKSTFFNINDVSNDDTWDPEQIASPTAALSADGSVLLWFHGEGTLMRTGHAWLPASSLPIAEKAAE